MSTWIRRLFQQLPPPSNDASRTRARLSVEPLEGRDVPAVVFTDTYTWAMPGSTNAATVEVTVEDDAPGYAGQYLWTYTVTNTGFTGDTDIGMFAVAVGDPDDVSAVGTSLDWSGYVGDFQNTQMVVWSGGEFTDNIGLNESASFWFVTSETGVQLTTGAAFAADAGYASTATGELPAPAPHLLVTTAQDVVDNLDGETSLREAVAAVDRADNVGGVWKIKFKSTLAGATITLNPSQGQIVLTKPVSIDGQNQGITVQRDSTSAVKHRLFLAEAESKVVRIAGLKMQNGLVDSDDGGAIRAAGAALSVVNCTFVNNEARGSRGGAISFNPGASGSRSLNISGSGFTGNKAMLGGALSLSSGAIASISSTSITLNIATDSGGGIFMYPGDATKPTVVTLSGVDVNGNSAVYKGAGIYVSTVGTVLTLTLTGGTTIQNNVVSSTTGKGGGIYFGKGTIELDGVWIGNNTATQGDGLYLVNTGTTSTIGSGGVTFFDDQEATGSA